MVLILRLFLTSSIHLLPDTVLICKITYTISVFSRDQMKKARSSRGAPAGTEIRKLDHIVPWDTLKAQVLAAISSALNPTTLVFEDYSITFTVPRQVTTPIQLNDDTKYDHLVEDALKIKKDANAKIVVEPKLVQPFQEQVTQNKENNEADNDNRKEKKRSRIPATRDILLANAALNAEIGKLRDKYICPTGRCPTGHCFVDPDDPDHFPLGNTHVESWAAAILKGPEFATIKKPPHDDLFNKINPIRLAARTPLLQRRAELRDKEKAANNTAPQINFNFPLDIANLFCPIPAALPPPPAVLDHNTSPMLIPASMIPGPALSIDDFCTQYDLDADICDRFKQHKFKGTKVFAYVALNDLKEMQFVGGEIAELKVAIAAWWAQILPA
ncbi:hypothetical protein DFH07DRAFT_730079 [Mycena maculata]|uniref:Uncharacterized protein n=1 Tax=Mycena maculata TaxID=230809 RepID=A0AAD7K876_9AGAR|nr:hypothetical protein DFH07DRAFT_730079 [Mycena maculata]